jgi:hypothetical protein
MGNAPERIWAWKFIPEKQNDVMRGGWHDAPDWKETEYTRTDLIPAWSTDMEAAPKDGTIILAWCDHKADNEVNSVYKAHCNAFGFHGLTGPAIVRFGGEWQTNDGNITDWWFDDDDFESPVFPTHWMHVTAPQQ